MYYLSDPSTWSTSDENHTYRGCRCRGQVGVGKGKARGVKQVKVHLQENYHQEHNEFTLNVKMLP